MDIKELIAKIKGKNKEGAAGGSRKQNSVSAFFQKNPSMKYIIAVIALVVSAAVALTIILSGRQSQANLDTNVTANEDAAVDVLPKLERDIGEDYDGKDPFDENVLDGAKLTGIYDFYGYKTATLQTSTKSYTLREGDTVGDTDWVVSEITDKAITLVSGDKTKTYSK